MDPVESTDFDFFDTPRNKDDSDSDFDNYKNHRIEKTEPRPSKVISNSDGSKRVENSPKKKHSSSSLSDLNDDYSSDSVSSLSDNESDNVKPKSHSKHSARTLSSDSSRSNSPLSQSRETKKSPQNRIRNQSDSLSGSDVSDSKSSTSGSSNHSGRKLKTRMGHRGSPRTKAVKDLPKHKQFKNEEDSYSSSAYSDGEETSNGIIGNSESDRQSRSFDSRSKRQEAWGMDNEEIGESSLKSSKQRPKTAKIRKENNRQKWHSPSSDSDTLSDSDITDVSPIDSPRVQDKSRVNRSSLSSSHVDAAGDGGCVKTQFRALPVNEKDLDEEAIEDGRTDSSGIDLKILMKAVGELEKKKRVEANSRRVMFAPMTLKRNDKSNYTFDRVRTHDIDRENDRLLKEIVKQVQSDRKKQFIQSSSIAPKSKLTASAVNRDREMRRIEMENLNFLKRLQKVKATSTISRTNQLKEYENTKLHGIPIATMHPMSRASSRSSQPTDSFSSIGSRTRSMTSLHSVASTVRSTSSKRGSRPSSATKRIDIRPEWNDRW